MERDQAVDLTHSGAESVEAHESGVDRVARKARETFGTDEKARKWIHRPTAALSGASPFDVLSRDDSGADQVVDLLRRIDHGLSV